MLLYIIYMTLCVDGGMMWFTFFFNSLLVFQFQDDYRSFDLCLILYALDDVCRNDFDRRYNDSCDDFLVPIVNYAILFHWMNARK